MFHYSMLEKHSSFLGPFVSYEENEMFWIQSLEPHSQHFIFLLLMKLPNKLECFITVYWKNTQAYWAHCKLWRKWSVLNTVPGATFTTLYFLLTYEIARKARMFHCNMPEKHSSLLGPFVSYEENEVFRIQFLEPHSQHFIFLFHMKLLDKLECFITVCWKNTQVYWANLLVMKGCEYSPWSLIHNTFFSCNLWNCPIS